MGVVDVFLAEVVELVDRFDAFGEGSEAEVPAELDEDADQRVGFGGAVDRVGERAVDLDRVDRELLERGERGVAGAEVVDRDVDAELP